MTRFRDAKVCNNWLRISIDDDRIQFDCKYKSELHGVTFAWWNRARHQWQRYHQGYWVHNDHVTTKTQNTFNTAHMNIDNVGAQFSCLLVSFVSSWFTHCTAWFNGESSIFSTSSSCSSFFICTSSTSFEGRSELVHSAWKGVDSFDDSYFLTC